MTELEWKSFLIDFIRVLNVEDDDLEFRDKARQLFTSAFSEAVEEDILAAEHRLKIKFPPSYRLFLKISNGWPEMGAAEPGELCPPQAIQWLRDQDPEMLEVWSTLGQDLSMEEHLHYRDVEDAPCWYCEEYLHNTLAISAYSDACLLLLSPDVIDKNGEWECWHLASWHPGAARYQSFETWIIETYKLHIERISEEYEFKWHSPILDRLNRTI